MAARHLLIGCFALSGCFPQFTEWREEATASSSVSSSSGVGGAASSAVSSASTGVGGGPLVCQDLGGECLSPPAGFSGPAVVSNMGCGELVKVLAVGNDVATTQPEVCHYAAKPEECTHANLLVSKLGECQMGFLIHDYKYTPPIDTCTPTPGSYSSFKVNLESKAQCESVDPLPFVAFDGQLDLCEDARPCLEGGHCIPSGAKRCVWVESQTPPDCPSDYPERIALKTADPKCVSGEAAVCTPELVFGPDCMLNSGVTTETLDGDCKTWPTDAANWALKPGTVASCADGPVDPTPARSITLCCTPPTP